MQVPGQYHFPAVAFLLLSRWDHVASLEAKRPTRWERPVQDCLRNCYHSARGVLVMRWCEEHESWIIAAWGKADGDTPFVEVHPMWLEPRVIAASELEDGTLSPLLRALQATVQRLERDAARGQMTLW